jgi:hypothetical protein
MDRRLEADTIAAFIKDIRMACPFFMPTHRFDDAGFPHPERLPLGAGWKGHCCAPGHEGEEPSADDLRDFCNLGYASACARRPKENAADAVRFAVTRDHRPLISILYSLETAHLPSGHGTLEYNCSSQQWTTSHPDAQILNLAQRFIESHVARRTPPDSSNPSSSTS